MKSFKEFLSEAKVSGKNIGKASQLIARYFSTQSGSDFVFFDNFDISRSDGEFKQCVYVDKSGTTAIGINWKSDGEFESIVLWDEFAIGKQPDREILIDADAGNTESFAKYLPRAVRMAYGETMEVDESVMTEAKSVFEYNGETYEGKEAAAKAMISGGEDLKDIAKTVKVSLPCVQRWAGEVEDEEDDSVGAKGKDKVTVRKPIAQVVKPSENEKAAKSKFDEVKYADPKVVFQDLEDLTKMVGTGIQTALLVTGSGGTGKSYTIEKVLSEYGARGKDFVIMKGRCTPRAMYMFLYYHYNQICVFDDCDSIFKDTDGLNILKAALDSGKNRIIGYSTADAIPTEGMNHQEIEAVLAAEKKPSIPSEFEFTGAVIFISNLTRKFIASKDSALLTRGACIDVTLKQTDIIDRIISVKDTIKYYKALGPEGSDKEITNREVVDKVAEFLKTEEFADFVKKAGQDVTFRTFINMCKCATVFGMKTDRWKQMSLYMV